MSREELAARIAYASLRMPIEDARVLLTRFSDEQELMESPVERLGVNAYASRSVMSQQSRLKLLEQGKEEADFVLSHDIHAIYFTDPDYPQKLLECHDAPLMLYALGDCDLNHMRVISIVGTRHATLYGIEMVQAIVRDLRSLMDEPLVVVSGLAFGIDIAAHKAALDNHIPTTAVLAQGLNTIYPPQHRLTAVKISQEGGMLLTDYRSCDAVHKGNFLARNRIIAGIADCVIVAESQERGGALNTARLAMDYDREVFAIPGRATDQYSRGCNNLIATNRAHLLTDASQLLDEMGWPQKAQEGTQPQLPNIDLEPEERAILTLLELRGEARLPEIMEVAAMEQKQASAKLIDLEFRGLVTAIPGGRYRLTR